uniref:Uncharacterized protein n=1 Tax=Ananas comosus var. bracteatus TaxID=296719 RepID=A0A6V7QI04_ANACO|nr:unnamed protein product [Ananas comosus var. bracteatus]
MLSANLFRPLLPPASLCCRHPPLESLLLDDDAPVASLAPLWPHLSIAYGILSASVSGADQASLREHAGHRFLFGLAALFELEDPRERDRLKELPSPTSRSPSESYSLAREIRASKKYNFLSPTKKVGCGPMAAAAAERGAAERRRWDAVAATARMAAVARVVAAASCRMRVPCGGGSEARRGGAEKVGCGSGNGKGGGSSMGGGSDAGGRIGGRSERVLAMAPLPPLPSFSSLDYTMLRQFVSSDPSRFILGPSFAV